MFSAVIANVDCSHTIPMFTLPFGGSLRAKTAKGDAVEITITKH